MTSENLVLSEAKKRGWGIVRKSRELGVTGVPCFVEPKIPGRCEIWVGIASDSSALQGGMDWQGGNLHVANIRGLTRGLVYDRNGNQIGNVTKSNQADRCTISIKRDAGEYKDAWEALKTYISEIYGGFRTDTQAGTQQPMRPYTFPIAGEKTCKEVEWLDLVRGDRIAVAGLGGVGSWIADIMTKSDVSELHAWDDDLIEDKNILRMPGAVHPKWIGKSKARWFEDTYRQIHPKVYGHEEKVYAGNFEEFLSGINFGFVAVDNDEGLEAACDALAGANIPFVNVGLSIDRRQGQVTVSVRLITAYPHNESWQSAVPRVDRSGQEVYGGLELPDISAMAVGLAVQSWRKIRGQLAQKEPQECLVYRAEDCTITVRSLSEVVP